MVLEGRRPALARPQACKGRGQGQHTLACGRCGWKGGGLPPFQFQPRPAAGALRAGVPHVTLLASNCSRPEGEAERPRRQPGGALQRALSAPEACRGGAPLVGIAVKEVLAAPRRTSPAALCQWPAPCAPRPLSHYVQHHWSACERREQANCRARPTHAPAGGGGPAAHLMCLHMLSAPAGPACGLHCCPLDQAAECCVLWTGCASCTAATQQVCRPRWHGLCPEL